MRHQNLFCVRDVRADVNLRSVQPQCRQLSGRLLAGESLVAPLLHGRVDPGGRSSAGSAATAGGNARAVAPCGARRLLHSVQRRQDRTGLRLHWSDGVPGRGPGAELFL